VRPGGEPWSQKTVRTAVVGSLQFLRWAAESSFAPSLSTKFEDIQLPVPPPCAKLGPTELRVYFDAISAEQEPYRSVLALLPQTGSKVRELCAAPIAGLTRSNSGPVFHIRKRGEKKIGFSEIAGFTLADCQSRLRPVLISRQTLTTFRIYLDWRRTAPSSPWLFPNPNRTGSYVSPEAVRNHMATIRDRLGLPWLTTYRVGEAGRDTRI
jgi:hypothetical protein